MSTAREYLSVKELAAALGVSTKTIFRAKRNGFKMPGKVATVAEYRAWHATAAAGRVPKCPVSGDASRLSIRIL